MRSILIVWLLLGSCSSLLPEERTAIQPIAASGQWVLYLTRGGEQFDAARVVLTQDGQTVTGTLNELKLVGTIRGHTIELAAVRPDGSEFGKFQINMTGIEWTGTMKRGKVETPLNMHRIGGLGTSPKTHTFVPTSYPRLFTGILPPVLHINPGDTVRTTTIDSGGIDEHGVSRALSGNPQTGPFYVEGAVPGDTLAVEVKRIRLNRSSASSTSYIAPVALTPEYYRNAKVDDVVSADWTLDLDHGTASLAKPTPRLKNFRIELKPMLGCVAVAPGNNVSFGTRWLGPWGGNIDYRGIREGTTVYLPVAQEGALLYLGDAHAEQGDGELNGDALETSDEVEFTVHVVPGVSTSGPRAENGEYLMSMGIAGSLDAAIKQATTQLAQWIENDYKLTPNEAAVILGTSIQYEIAELVDPQVNVVAKVRKAVLTQLSK